MFNQGSAAVLTAALPRTGRSDRAGDDRRGQVRFRFRCRDRHCRRVDASWLNDGTGVDAGLREKAESRQACSP